jgi:hypothetical protein
MSIQAGPKPRLSDDEVLARSGGAGAGATQSATTAELLRDLRRAFPDMSLAERVRTLQALSRG